ncbi:distal membrane-arm assembly complex protein 2 isoform X2 [Esox lucius]|uniref:distal membrane-arm assembly complex protein 2 isoform X2 n=1 Tax=Esox lucius TaxID=8010 RepID=UPI001476A444|nr:distal membrane-arm assembly complex protein 2 isoform X2 [Esox lucius]
MAKTSMRRTFRLVPLLAATPRHWSSNPGAPPPLQTRLLLYLSHRFHDVETLLSWIPWLKSRGVRQKNIFYGYTQENFGDNVAAAFYILSLRGGFRFAGQSEWFRSNKRGKFSWDFINQRDATIEEVDASNTLINYTGLENLVKQKSLRTLSLCGCVEVDDWFLSRLHVFQDTLEELDISHCPQITVGGLASLRNLRALRRLDISSLPKLQDPGLVAILLEEMLPQCQVTAFGFDHSLTYSHTPTDAQRTESVQEQ